MVSRAQPKVLLFGKTTRCRYTATLPCLNLFPLSRLGERKLAAAKVQTSALCGIAVLYAPAGEGQGQSNSAELEQAQVVQVVQGRIQLGQRAWERKGVEGELCESPARLIYLRSGSKQPFRIAWAQ